MTGWYNFVTEEYDQFDGFPNEQDFDKYFPQYEPAKNMYRLLLDMGKTPIEALLQVLKACTSDRS